jgi:hypothetical protein
MVRPEKLRRTSGCKSRRGKQAGAPRSRLRASGEILPSERSVKSPAQAVGFARGEQSSGPSASEPLQPREIKSRKAKRPSPSCPGEGNRLRVWTGAAQDSSGVGKAARCESSARNRRDPPWRPTSGKDCAYKAKPKSRRAKRESERLVVPGKAAKVAGGKGPYFGPAVSEVSVRAWSLVDPTTPLQKRENSWSRYTVVPSVECGRFLEPRHCAGVTPRGSGAQAFRLPAHAHGGRPSVSRMREIRMYGLNGGDWRRGR